MLRNAISILMLVALCAGAAPGAAVPTEAARLYREAYGLERGRGDLEKAIELYQAALAAASNSAPVAPSALFRIGMCSRMLGLTNNAQSAWTRLIDNFPDESELLDLATTEMQRMMMASQWIGIRGVVCDPSGNPVPGAYVLAGEWMLEPPVVTDAKGAFFARRKIIRGEWGGRTYCRVYAEHPFLSLAGVAVAEVNGNAAAAVRVGLLPMTNLAGRVVDVDGRPVAGAQVILDAVLPGKEPVPLPYHLLVGPVQTERNGSYRIPNLVPSLRYEVGAAKSGYRPALHRPPSLPADATLVLEPIGRAFMAGLITDESGSPVEARVTAFSMPPSDRELASTRSAKDGRYRFPYLPADRVVVQADAGPGYATRRLTGVEAGRDDLDFVLTQRKGPGRSAVMGRPAPEIRAEPVNGPALSLAHLRGRAVLLYFWDRRRQEEPLRRLKEYAARYHDRGLSVVCIHDHSGYVPDLVRTVDREHIEYPVAIDEYIGADAAGARNSATMAMYGASPGQAALVDTAGDFDSIWDFSNAESQPRLVQRIEALLSRIPFASESADVPAPTLVGMPAPGLQIARWVRGEPLNGGAVTLGDLAGRIAVLHFSSPYISASLRKDYPDERLNVEQMEALYGPSGVSVLWILPSGDNSAEAERLAATTMPAIPIGVDDAGKTYGAYGIRSYSCDCVIDAQGRVRAITSSGCELFRVLKSLVQEQGLEGSR